MRDWRGAAQGLLDSALESVGRGAVGERQNDPSVDIARAYGILNKMAMFGAPNGVSVAARKQGATHGIE